MEELEFSTKGHVFQSFDSSLQWGEDAMMGPSIHSQSRWTRWHVWFPKKDSGTPQVVHVSRCVINSARANFTPYWQSATCKSTTVDGWNPAPPGMYKTLQIMGKSYQPQWLNGYLPSTVVFPHLDFPFFWRSRREFLVKMGPSDKKGEITPGYPFSLDHF